ncbi:hypothetical protein [Dehalobacterium formicoaceticum]|uniref:hypothetical protein n=1 Tax=Dehalobacterium formicoaceticum TaxID=51515 RepID=UPI000B7E3FF8|nr:hypothetical protein [Dehalobacterium formicoaceticum]
MPIFSVIAYSALIIAIVSTFLAVKGKYQFYWISAMGIYIFSFLAGFSIGLITVGLTFIPLILAMGHSFGWIKNKRHSIIFLCIGIIIGFLMVMFIGSWLFYPLFPLFNILS